MHALFFLVTVQPSSQSFTERLGGSNLQVSRTSAVIQSTVCPAINCSRPNNLTALTICALTTCCACDGSFAVERLSIVMYSFGTADYLSVVHIPCVATVKAAPAQLRQARLQANIRALTDACDHGRAVQRSKGIALLRSTIHVNCSSKKQLNRDW